MAQALQRQLHQVRALQQSGELVVGLDDARAVAADVQDLQPLEQGRDPGQERGGRRLAAVARPRRRRGGLTGGERSVRAVARPLFVRRHVVLEVQLLQMGHGPEQRERRHAVVVQAENLQRRQGLPRVHLRDVRGGAGDEVVREVQLQELAQAVQVLNGRDAVVREPQLPQVVQPLQSLDFAELVPGEVEKREMRIAVEVHDGMDGVALQVQRLELGERLQSIDVPEPVVLQLEHLSSRHMRPDSAVSWDGGDMGFSANNARHATRS